MTPTLFTVKNSLNINLDEKKKQESKNNLVYFFVLKTNSAQDKICFSVFLKNNQKFLMNTVWFSAFVGIGETIFAPGLEDQESFYIRTSDLGQGQYLYGYTKEHVKLPPQATLEILYFEIPKRRLEDAGSLEFYFGSESVKKVSFIASWEEGQLQNKLSEVNSKNFLNFLKYKNKKTIFESLSFFVKKFIKNLVRFLIKVKNLIVKDRNF